MELVARGCGLTFHPVFLYEALYPFYLNHFELLHLLGWFLVKIEHWLERFLGWHELGKRIEKQLSNPNYLWGFGLYSRCTPDLGGRVCGRMVCSVNCHQVNKGLMLRIATSFTDSFLKLWIFILDQRYIVGPFGMKCLLFSVTFESLFLHERLRSITLHTSENSS